MSLASFGRLTLLQRVYLGIYPPICPSWANLRSHCWVALARICQPLSGIARNSERRAEHRIVKMCEMCSLIADVKWESLPNPEATGFRLGNGIRELVTRLPTFCKGLISLSLPSLYRRLIRL